MRRKLGDGKQIRFWSSWMSSGEPLKLKYKRLFDVSNQQQSKIGEMGVWRGELWEWQLEWRRELFHAFYRIRRSVRATREYGDDSFHPVLDIHTPESRPFGHTVIIRRKEWERKPQLRREEPDSWLWTAAGDWVFSVKTAYEVQCVLD